MRNLAAAILIVASSLPTMAQTNAALTVGELRAICNDVANASRMACNSYMQGFLGGSSWALLFTKDLPSARYCLPSSGITIRRVVTIFLDYADKSPNKLNEPAHIELYSALMADFPCK